MITHSGKALKFNNKWFRNVAEGPTPPVDPYNPLGLPAYTMRLKYTEGFTPSFSNGTAVQVSSSPNVWDLTYENTSWDSIFDSHTNLIEVLGANTTGVTNMGYMFSSCSSLTSVQLFDTTGVTYMACMFTYCSSLTSVPLFVTTSVTDMRSMFNGCSSLTSVQLFDTTAVTDMSSMFKYCSNVESGALALYQQASTQTTPPSEYYDAFTECGNNTVTGAAELAQIPTSWGGTMS